MTFLAVFEIACGGFAGFSSGPLAAGASSFFAGSGQYDWTTSIELNERATPIQAAPKREMRELAFPGMALATASHKVPITEPPIAPKRNATWILGTTRVRNSAGSWMSCR